MKTADIHLDTVLDHLKKYARAVFRDGLGCHEANNLRSQRKDGSTGESFLMLADTIDRIKHDELKEMTS